MDIIIVGAGKLGEGLAKRLSEEEENNVTVIDTNSEKIDKMIDRYDIQGICGSGTHIDILEQAEVGESDLVISTTMSDENNILTCLIAKKLGTKNTIARVRNPEYNSQLNFMKNELGISMMVNPDYLAAQEISKVIQFPSAVNVETFSNGIINMAEFIITTNSPFAGKKIREISAKYKPKMIICVVKRGDSVYIPNGDFVIQVGDKINVTGKHKNLSEIARILLGAKSHSIKDVMVIGASRVGIYLTEILSSMGKHVILVENNRDKCKKTFDMISNAIIINGDANDHDVLIENGISRMDAVVTLTNTDEINFLISLYAKKLGVPKTITKINNINFQKMLDEIGLDSRVNVSEISIDLIVQYIRAKTNASSSYMKTLYRIVNGTVETIEFIAGPNTKCLNVPLSEIKMKSDTIIAAIHRDSETIFPAGHDSIQENDSVIVVSKSKRINSLNDILE